MFFSLLMCSQFYVRITADDKLMCYGCCSIYTHKLLTSVLFYYIPRLRRRNRVFNCTELYGTKEKNKSLCFVHFADHCRLYAGAWKNHHRPDRFRILSHTSENLNYRKSAAFKDFYTSYLANSCTLIITNLFKNSRFER